MSPATAAASGRSQPRQAPPSRAARRMAVQTTGASDVVVRILVLLQRRRCTLAHVDFSAGDRHCSSRLVIGYEAPHAHADRVLQWVAAVVDVLPVEPYE